MKPTLYIEITIVSYLAAYNSRDLVMAARQQTTRDWWEKRRKGFDLFVSRLVWQEAASGDPEAAGRRLKVLRPLRWLQMNKDDIVVAKALVTSGPVPRNAADDALHIGLAAAHGMHFLLTWNFTHINNAATEEEIKNVCERHGFHCPVICTPDELMEI